MKKILSAHQIRQADEHTIATEPVSSCDLMERASEAFVVHAKKYLSRSEQIYIFCGRGNNGGDGFAIGRLLKNEGYSVICYAVGDGAMSPDCKINADRVGPYETITVAEQLPPIGDQAVVVDALFGSGLNRPVDGLAKTVVEHINASGAFVLSVDIPSGMYCDAPFVEGLAVRADVAISFQRPKLSFFMPESAACLRHWAVVDIGLDESFIQQQASDYYLLDNDVRGLVKKRDRYSHKGTYGHVLVMAGSYGMMGAAQLTSRAALKSGAGLVTAYCPACGYQIMQIAVPECMCLTDQNETHLTGIPDLAKYSAIALGPGIGTANDTAQAVLRLLKTCSVPLVIDADAITVLAQHKPFLDYLPAQSILAPHPKEFERLVGPWHNSEERLKLQTAFSKEYRCYVIYKDAHTTVSTPDGRLYFNTSGNPGMATAGSGDVLTGVVASLLAQSYSPLSACLIGVFEHGDSGDRAAMSMGAAAVVASDIIAHLRIGQ